MLGINEENWSGSIAASNLNLSFYAWCKGLNFKLNHYQNSALIDTQGEFMNFAKHLSQVLGLLMAVLYISAPSSLAQSVSHSFTISKLAAERNTIFVERATHQPLIEGQPVASKNDLLPGKSTLVAFTADASPNDAPDYDIVLNVLIDQGDGAYRLPAPVTACEIEGGSATLRAFFFIRLDHAPTKDIGVICGWDTPHAFDASSCGLSDEVRFFHVTENAITEIQMQRFEHRLYKTVTAPDGEGEPLTCQRPAFGSVSDVKRLLRSAN